MREKNTLIMRHRAQSIVYRYCRYLMRFRKANEDKSKSFFNREFKYGFKGKSLLPTVACALKGIAAYSHIRKGVYIYLSAEESIFFGEEGEIDVMVHDVPKWFDMMTFAEVVTHQYIEYLVDVLHRAVEANNKIEYLPELPYYESIQTSYEEIERALQSRGL